MDKEDVLKMIQEYKIEKRNKFFNAIHFERKILQSLDRGTFFVRKADHYLKFAFFSDEIIESLNKEELFAEIDEILSTTLFGNKSTEFIIEFFNKSILLKKIEVIKKKNNVSIERLSQSNQLLQEIEDFYKKVKIEEK